MDDCTQEVMLRCMHVLSITGCRSKSKTNILSKSHDNCLKNVTVRVIKRFSTDVAM